MDTYYAYSSVNDEPSYIDELQDNIRRANEWTLANTLSEKLALGQYKVAEVVDEITGTAHYRDERERLALAVLLGQCLTPEDALAVCLALADDAEDEGEEAAARR